MRSLVLAVVVFLAVVQTGLCDTLTCYSGELGSRTQMSNCHTSCKNETVVEHADSDISFGCADKVHPGAEPCEDITRQMKNTNDLAVRVCYCNTNLCNGSNGVTDVRPVTLFSLVSVFLALMSGLAM